MRQGKPEWREFHRETERIDYVISEGSSQRGDEMKLEVNAKRIVESYVELKFNRFKMYRELFNQFFEFVLEVKVKLIVERHVESKAINNGLFEQLSRIVPE